MWPLTERQHKTAILRGSFARDGVLSFSQRRWIAMTVRCKYLLAAITLSCLMWVGIIYGASVMFTDVDPILTGGNPDSPD
jgi:hypothetical protein